MRTGSNSAVLAKLRACTHCAPVERYRSPNSPTGLNRVHLYRLENGRQNMTLNTLKIIADTLGVRVRDLIGKL
jgi:DNA-binding phage protein